MTNRDIWENIKKVKPTESGQYRCSGVYVTETGGLRTFNESARWDRESGEWFDEHGKCYTELKATVEYWKNDHSTTYSDGWRNYWKRIK